MLTRYAAHEGHELVVSCWFYRLWSLPLREDAWHKSWAATGSLWNSFEKRRSVIPQCLGVGLERYVVSKSDAKYSHSTIATRFIVKYVVSFYGLSFLRTYYTLGGVPPVPKAFHCL